MKTAVSIIIADDHPIFRRGLRGVIETEANFNVVAEADDGEAAFNLIQDLKPDVAVLDVNMPEMTGIEVVRKLQTERSDVKIIFLTMHRDEEFFNAAMDLGVKGYILKDSAVTDIVACIKSVSRNQPFISSSLSSLLLGRSRKTDELKKEIPQLERLTPTERRVLQLIADYKTSKEIAEILCVHSRTVDNHRTNICQKLELKGSLALLKFAAEHKSQI